MESKPGSLGPMVSRLRLATLLAIPALLCLCGPFASLTMRVAFAQDGLPRGLDTEEVVLTQAGIDGLLAAQPDFAREAGGNFYHPEAGLRPTAEAIAKRHGFEDFDALRTVVRKIENVMDGIDEAGAYVGRKQLTEKEIALIEADRSRSADEKAAMANSLRRFRTSLKDNEVPSEDIALVVRNYGRLRKIIGDGSD